MRDGSSRPTKSTQPGSTRRARRAKAADGTGSLSCEEGSREGLGGFLMRRRCPVRIRHAADVLLLSRIVGQDVRGPDEQSLGRLVDLTVSLAEQNGPTLVDRILVRRGGARDLLV